jgi:hypothetical protein
MNTLYLCLTAILGTIMLTFGLTNLAPQGMWIYIAAVMWGTASITAACVYILRDAEQDRKNK